MDNNIISKKIKFQWKLFWRNYILWIFSIPINIIPFLFKQLNGIADTNFPGIQKLISMMLSDFEFSFISVSVLFILCIEGYFVDQEISRRFWFLSPCLFTCFCSLLLLYCLFFFRPDLFSLMSFDLKVKYNIIIILSTVILGCLCNASISVEVGS